MSGCRFRQRISAPFRPHPTLRIHNGNKKAKEPGDCKNGKPRSAEAKIEEEQKAPTLNGSEANIQEVQAKAQEVQKAPTLNDPEAPALNLGGHIIFCFFTNRRRCQIVS